MSEETSTTTRNARRMATGIVTSDKMDKTIKVTTQRYITHPIYEKRLRRKTVYTAHDENNEAKVGDTVEIMEVRKLSKTKSWRLVNVTRRADR